MIGNSDTYPEITVKSNNKTQIRYNIVETTIEDMNNESRICYNFEYVEIEGELSRDKIISAIIGNVYSIEQEIALINNELYNLGTNEHTEYVEYQNLRDLAKTVSDNAGYTKIE
jgi:hypothetical protein